MHNRVLRLAGLAAVVVVAGGAPPAPVHADAEVTVTLTPTACFDPCSVRVRARISPDAENRSLAITADSGRYLRRSVIQLDGEDAARSYVETYTDLPAGTYEITARVERSSGETFIATRNLAVQGQIGGELPPATADPALPQ
jgi:hypothetical protein